MAISREEVLHVAALARLELTEEEVERFREQLNAILEAVGKVAELDLSNVEPTAHPLDLVNAWADDEPHQSLPLDAVFANAPAREDDLFRVPPTATATCSESPQGEPCSGPQQVTLPAQRRLQGVRLGSLAFR